MASSTTPSYTALVTSETEGGKNISLTWTTITPVVDKEFATDLAVGSNTITFGLSTADPAPKQCIIIPPSSNTNAITLSTGGVRIHPSNPTVLGLDSSAPVTSIVLVNGGASTIAGVKIIIL